MKNLNGIRFKTFVNFNNLLKFLFRSLKQKSCICILIEGFVFDLRLPIGEVVANVLSILVVISTLFGYRCFSTTQKLSANSTFKALKKITVLFFFCNSRITNQRRCGASHTEKNVSHTQLCGLIRRWSLWYS